MELTINGEKRVLPPNLSVGGLLDHLKVRKETVVVEHNLKVLKRENLPETFLQAGDTIEIIRLVGGG